MDNYQIMYYLKIIKDMAKGILDRMRGGMLYGITLDEHNIDMLIVMAYELGKAESAAAESAPKESDA
jgi:hypothetical protein